MRPGSWLSRIVAVVLPFVFLAAAYILILAPLADAYENALTRIDLARNKITHFRAAKARLPLLEASLKAQRQELSEDVLLPRASAPEIQGVLQAAVQKLLAGSGVEALSSRLSPPALRGSFTVFEAELDLRGSPPHWAKFVTALESAVPVLRVEKLTLSVPEGGQGPVDEEGQPILSIRANIAALARPIYGKNK